MLPISHYLEQRVRPKGGPAMLQSWRDLCFLHFLVDPKSLRKHIPEELEIDTFPNKNGEEQAWIGIVTFRMEGVRFPEMPPLPWLSAFPETNVRTYVHHKNGNPGVWFFSLDASQRLACEYARKFFGLNYLHSHMSISESADTIDYKIRRLDEPHAALSLSYEKPLSVAAADPGSFEFWLVERYLLYTAINGQLYAGKVAHEPYRIGKIDAYALDTDLPESIGLPQSQILHAVFSPGVDVEVHGIAPVA